MNRSVGPRGEARAEGLRYDRLAERSHQLAQPCAPVLAEHFPAREHQLVGGLLDLFTRGAAGVGERSSGVEPEMYCPSGISTP